MRIISTKTQPFDNPVSEYFPLTAGAGMFCRTTVHIPGEGVSELLAVDLHVQSDWNQNLCL